MSRGVLFFAHNNEEFNYYDLARVNSLYVKKHLNVPCAVVTDNNSINNKKHAFDHIIYVNDSTTNRRLFKDTSLKTQYLSFNNIGRAQAYDLTPYDETIVIDADYLIRSNQLSACWGAKYDILINKDTWEIVSDRQSVPHLINEFSIEMYWATVIYFKKSNTSRLLFELVKHIKNYYSYYINLYNLPTTVFRNDFAFSIAIHIMGNEGIVPLPGRRLYQSFDGDTIYSVEQDGSIVFNAEYGKQVQNMLTRDKDTDVHVMNKWALLSHLKTLEDQA